MSSYKVGQVSALLGKNQKGKSKGARDNKFKKLFDESTKKPFAEFLKKENLDQGSGKLLKKSKKKSFGSKNSLTPETSISECESNSAPRLVIKCKQKKRKFEDVETVDAAPDQCSKKQKKSPPVPRVLTVEEPCEFGTMNGKKIKVKAAKMKKKMAKILSGQEEVDTKSNVAIQNQQDFPPQKGKKKKKFKSCQTSTVDSELIRNVPQHNVSEYSDDEDLVDEMNSSFVSIPKGNAANKKKNKRKVKVLSNPEELDIESCDANREIVESQSDVRLPKVSEDSLDDDIPDLDGGQQSEDEDSGEERPKGDCDFIPVPKTKFCGFDGREDTPERLQRTVFVGNLPTSTNRKQLKVLLQPFGRIESVRIRSAIPPKETMTKKIANIRQEYHENCYSLNGFVVFVKKEYAEEALSLDGTIVKNHHIRVDLASNEGLHDNKSSVFVGNLPFNIDEDKVWSAFEEVGAVKAVRVMRDRETGIGRGCGFVQFKDKEMVNEALKLNGENFFGRDIRVKIVEDFGKGKNYKSPNASQKKWRNKTPTPLNKKSKKKTIHQRKELQMRKRAAFIFSK